MNHLIPSERIDRRIYLIRSQKVILSLHLADLYEVEPKVLIQAVKRNMARFPTDFMFQLTDVEFKILKSQIVTSSWGGIRRANPYAFTEQGVAMLSAVLRSQCAIQVSIEIMRAFVRLRHLMTANKDLAQKFEKMEKKYDYQFKVVFEAIDQLMEQEPPPDEKISFTKVKGFGP